MALWLQFGYKKNTMMGVLNGDTIDIYIGDMFNDPQPVGETCRLDEVEILMPCTPGKMLALWNNFYSRAEHEGWDIPAEPLYFVKTPNSFHAHAQPIIRPPSYDGPVVFEGELGVVIGKTCVSASETEAADYIFGYTCINDVTAKEILRRDTSFMQWTRAKGFNTFGIFGPCIATGLDVDTLVIQSRLDGVLLQDYPVTDMVFRPHKLISMISQDIPLYAGDVVACGTALHAGVMEDGQIIEVSIDGIGVLSNQMTSG